MTQTTKRLHVAAGSMAGMYASGALCGRRVNRLSLLAACEADRVTCPKCADKAALAGLLSAASV